MKEFKRTNVLKKIDEIEVISQVLQQKRRNPYEYWATPISLYSVMGAFLE